MIFIQPGSYQENAAISISSSKIILEGSGPETIILAPSSGLITLQVSEDGVTIKNMTITQTASASSFGVYFNNVEDCKLLCTTISRTSASNATGIYISNTRNLIIENNTIVQNGGGGMIGVWSMNASIYTKIVNNYFNISTQINTTISLEGTSNAVITGNVINNGISNTAASADDNMVYANRLLNSNISLAGTNKPATLGDHNICDADADCVP